MLAFFRHLLDVVSWCWVIADVQHPCKAIQTVADCDVQSLTKDSVPLCRVGDHLCVASTHVENDGIFRSSDCASHLNVSDAVVHTHEWLSPELTQCPRCHSHSIQRRTHTRTLGVANAVHVFQLDICLLHRLFDQPYDPSSVVCCCVLRQEASAWRRYKSVSQV
jgi:hypothetical protein